MIKKIHRIEFLSFTILILLFNPYNATIGDHYHYLPYFFKLQNSEFLKFDWYYNEIEDYHYIFNYTLYFLTKIISLDLSLFILYIIYLSIIVYGFLIITNLLNFSIFFKLLTIILLMYGNYETSGKYLFLGDTALPSYLGLSLAFVVLAKLMQNKIQHAIFIAVILFYIHVSVGFWILLIVYSYLIIILCLKKMERQLFIKTTLILFAILPRLYFGLDNSYQNLNLEFDNILLKSIFDFRLPHHVAYFSFGNDLNKFNFYLFMIGIALSILNRLYFILYFIIFVIFYNIAGYYFYYLNFNFEIVSLFPYRLNPLLIPIFFILSIYTLINNSINFKFKFLGLISIFLYFFYFSNLSFKIEFFLLLLLLLSYLILKIKIKNNLLEIASSILILIIFILFTPMSTKGFKNTLVDSNFRDISKYLSTNDLVLTYFDINPAFRISTGTGIIVDYKSVPAGNRQALINWYSRISDLDHLNQKEPNEILNLANKYGASAVLLSQEYQYSLLPFEKINADIYIVQKFILIKL